MKQIAGGESVVKYLFNVEKSLFLRERDVVVIPSYEEEEERQTTTAEEALTRRAEYSARHPGGDLMAEGYILNPHAGGVRVPVRLRDSTGGVFCYLYAIQNCVERIIFTVTFPPTSAEEPLLCSLNQIQ